MAALMTLEALLVIATGLFALYAVPAILAIPSTSGLFWAGFLMAMAFMVMYALGALASSRIPSRARLAAAVIAWAAAFAVSPYTGRLVAAALGLLLALLGAFRERTGRLDAGCTVLLVYSLAMALGRWVLMPMLLTNPVAPDLAWLCGTFYVGSRVLVRIIRPTAVEGAEGAPPLVHRPVPDAVVGLVEAVTKRRARPFYTAPEGGMREDGISLLVDAAEAQAVADKVKVALGEKPFVVEIGAPAGGQVELVVRSPK